MRFLFLYSAYPAYLRQFYRARTGLEGAPYAEQREAFRADAFGWADFWTHYLSPLGIQADECLVNALPAQAAWAREHGIRTPRDPVRDVAAARVAEYAPDVVFFDDYTTFSEAWVRELRARVPSIRLIVAWCGAPYRDGSFFRSCDLVLSCIPGLVEEFRKKGHRSDLLRHGFDRRILRRLEAALPQPPIPLSFVGSIGGSEAAHGERDRLLAGLSRRFELQVYTPYAERTVAQRLRARASALLGRSSPARIPAALRKSMRPSVFGMEMFRTLAASRVTLNSHISISRTWATNMRLYEATGVGACLLTDWTPDLREVFEPDRDVVAYRSPEECAEKISYLLDHPAERDRIAACGQERTLREHGFERRAEALAGMLTAALKSRQ